MITSARWRVGLFVIAPALLAPAKAAKPAIDGLWDATVVANGVTVPFRFEIAQHGTRGFFFEGDRKIGSTSGTFQNGLLKLDYDFLNTTLEATLSGVELRGTYLNHRPKSRPLEFSARRFTPVPAATEDPPQIAGNWDMRRTSQDKSKLDVSWKLYLRQSGPAVSGAILKTSGDTGLLTGAWKNGKLVMSHFAGERPLLFEAQLSPDGTLSVTLDQRFTYRAARTAEARAKGIPDPPDPSRFTSVKDPTERFHFRSPDLDGKIVSDADPRFQDKVVVLTIGGSWCPNCHDEAPFLVDLYNQYHARGLEVVGLMFESDAELALARPRVLSFIKQYKIPFLMLVPGIPDDVAVKLPQLVNFGAFPTTIYLGRDGRVRSVQAGFASAATGDEHTRREQQERQMVEQLLAENSR